MKKYFLSLLVLFSVNLYAQFNNTNTDKSSILSAGVISITIGGDFIITGTFPAALTERVDQFVTRMYNQAKEQTLSNINDPEFLIKVKKQLDDYSIRNIKLKRSSGEEFTLDLLKFRTNGDFKNNPYLRNDDVLIFPANDPERNFFTITGAVNKPGKFMFTDGDKLSDAIELAQGINKAYENVDSVKINRLSYDGEELTSIRLSINNDFDLQRGDRIIVLAEETQRKEFSVTVAGEVNLPGKIPITKNNTTLKEVIKAAGGLKKDASLKRARLFTGSSVPLLLEELYGVRLENTPDLLELNLPDQFISFENLLMSRLSNMTVEDTSYFFLENRIRILNEGTGVDFTELNEDDSQASKYIVKNGDIIIIPQRQYSVYVFGQVVEPGYINYLEGEDFRYYINKAGGYGEYAEDEDEVMIIKSSNRNWISPTGKEFNIEAGDYIWVPKDPPRSFNFYVGTIGNYLSIVGSVATLILLLVQFTKK